MAKETALVVALDVPTFDEAVDLAEKFSGMPVWMKIGLELFTACGKDIVSAVRELGFPVFLDLKFHDIPHTVARAVAPTASFLLTRRPSFCQAGVGFRCFIDLPDPSFSCVWAGIGACGSVIVAAALRRGSHLL